MELCLVHRFLARAPHGRYIQRVMCFTPQHPLVRSLASSCTWFLRDPVVMGQIIRVSTGLCEEFLNEPGQPFMMETLGLQLPNKIPMSELDTSYRSIMGRLECLGAAFSNSLVAIVSLIQRDDRPTMSPLRYSEHIVVQQTAMLGAFQVSAKPSKDELDFT